MIVLKHRPSLVLPCPFLILASPSPSRVSAGKAPAVLQNQPFTRQEVEAQFGISTHPKIIMGCQRFDGLPGGGVCCSVTLCSCSSRKAVPVCCWEGSRLGIETAASISGKSHARNRGLLLLGELFCPVWG